MPSLVIIIHRSSQGLLKLLKAGHYLLNESLHCFLAALLHDRHLLNYVLIGHVEVDKGDLKELVKSVYLKVEFGHQEEVLDYVLDLVRSELGDLARRSLDNYLVLVF